MLRKQFGKPKRRDDGLVREVNEAVDAFVRKLRERCCDRKNPPARIYRLGLLAGGFKDAYNELEQSKFAAEQYAARVRHEYLEDMDEEEQDDYRLHVYYYKNAVIRIFSTLDKAGHFLNEMYGVRTEREKRKFSYYTFLRTMYKRRIHPELEKNLYAIKTDYREPMLKLRERRNLEIHHVNVEMLDDLVHLNNAFADKTHIEDVGQHLALLKQGFEMVGLSLRTAFLYAAADLESKWTGKFAGGRFRICWKTKSRW